MTQTIHPLILCGGSGTRLWPLSRKSYPKQFTKLTGEESLFQASARRLAGDGYAAPDLPPAGPSLMTRVCRFDFGSRRFRAWQAWQARSPQIAQAPAALALAFCSPAKSAA